MSVDFTNCGKAHKQGLSEGSRCSENVVLSFAGGVHWFWCILGWRGGMGSGGSKGGEQTRTIRGSAQES